MIKNNKAIAFGAFILLFAIYLMMGQNSVPTGSDERTLPELEAVSPEVAEGAVRYFLSKDAPTDLDLHNLAYALVAFSFTPLTLPSDYQDRYQTSHGGGVVAGLRNITKSAKNIAERTKEVRRLEVKFKPKKELAREKGVQIWHKLASRNYEQAIIGLAWYYGKTNQYPNAYFFRRIAFLKGDEASAYWAKKYSRQLSSKELVQLEEEVEAITGQSYVESFEAALAKDLLKTMKRLENIDTEINAEVEKIIEEIEATAKN